MIDEPTRQAYDSDAQAYAQDWESQPAPTDLYELLGKYFAPGPTVDIGCGSGREVAWLATQGYDALGVDSSTGLLAQARLLHPGLRFVQDQLPELSSLARGSFQNVACETVIMHLGLEAIAPATRSLLALRRPGGTLYLSWRVTPDQSLRDARGRLYSAFAKDMVLREVAQQDQVLIDQEETSVSSGKTIQRLVIRAAS